MRSRIVKGFFVAVGAVFILALATAPARLVNEAPITHADPPLDDWLAQTEQAAAASAPLIPGTEKHIHWYQGRRDSRTPKAIVYLHGFSASRQELSPVPEEIADRIGANLFETRLKGHGRLAHALEDVSAEDWLKDAAEALAIGTEIGDRIVLMGTSTGATLALAMAGHPSFRPVTDLVLISPNFGPADGNAELLTWPGGRWLAYALVGRTRSWQSKNELQARYWSTSYPMDAAVEMMRLVQFVRASLPLGLDASLLVFYSPADQVVDTGAIISAFDRIESPRRRLIAIPDSGDRSHHVLAGNILSPGNNEAMVDQVVEFLGGQRGQASIR